MRCELRVTSGTYQGRRMWLRDGQTIQIGRTEYADLCIADDPLMSRVHFALDSDGGMLRLRDLGSRNGTYVNGELVKIQELRHGDLIVAGQTRFDVMVEATDESGTRFDEGGSGVYQPGAFGANPGVQPSGSPSAQGAPQPTGSYSGPGYPGSGVPTSVTGYGTTPPPANPPSPPYAGSPGPAHDPSSAPTQYPQAYPPPPHPGAQNPSAQHPSGQHPGATSGPQAPPSGAYPGTPPGPGYGQPSPPPGNSSGGYPTGAPYGPGQSHSQGQPPSPNPPYAPQQPPSQHPPAPAGPHDSVFGSPPYPGGGSASLPPGNMYPPAGVNPPPTAGGPVPPGPFPSQYPPPSAPGSGGPAHPGQSLYGSPEAAPHELGSGTYQNPASQTSPPPSNDPSASEPQSPIEGATPFAPDASTDPPSSAYHRTPFDEPEDENEVSSSPFGTAGEAAEKDPKAEHQSPFDSSVTAAMQTLAGDFSNIDPSLNPYAPTDRHREDVSEVHASQTNLPVSPAPSNGGDEDDQRDRADQASSQSRVSDETSARASQADQRRSDEEPAPPPQSVGWSITAEDLPKPPKTPNDSTANLVPKSVPTDKLPTQTIGNEIAVPEQESTPYGTAIFDSSLDESTLAYGSFSSVFANVAYRESQSEGGLRCFDSHGEKSNAADIAKSLSERNQMYALVNVARLEESSRRVIDSSPGRSAFTTLANDLVLITKSDPLDFIGLLRSNWGRDALILLTARLQKQKVLRELGSRSHLFQQPSTLSRELQQATPEDAKTIFGALESFLIEGTPGKRWTIFLSPTFEGDWMHLGMPCPPGK